MLEFEKSVQNMMYGGMTIDDDYTPTNSNHHN